MKHFISVSALLVLIASPARLETSAARQIAANRHQEMVTTYCVTCHSTRARMGGLALEGLDLQAAADHAEIWEKGLRKLRGNQMPPPGSPQPPQKDVESFVAWMENTLDTNAKGPKAGYLPIQRLNRSEYAASVKALVGVDVNPKEVLPQDIQVEGFDNIAGALSVSPAFLDQYVTAARHIAQIAVGGASSVASSRVEHSMRKSAAGTPEACSSHAMRRTRKVSLEPGRTSSTGFAVGDTCSLFFSATGPGTGGDDCAFSPAFSTFLRET
jgi:mono/diheme cytochrome c family protein